MTTSMESNRSAAEARAEAASEASIYYFGRLALGEVKDHGDERILFRPSEDYFSDTTRNVGWWSVPALVRHEGIGENTLTPTTDLLTTSFEQ